MTSFSKGKNPTIPNRTIVKKWRKEGSDQEKSIKNVTETCHCQLLLSHSIITSLESLDPCFQELGPRW